jgi:hypothetical protein
MLVRRGKWRLATIAAWVLIIAGVTAENGSATVSGKAGGCIRGSLEGEVNAGAGYVHPIGDGLEVMLEPLASGWILRILPASGPRPAHDYAELATPPYQSVSPLLISTDFSFRAQDAVAWNPRQFRFAADTKSFQQMSVLYGSYQRDTVPPANVQNQLAVLVSHAPAGLLQILDARLVPGTANQAKTAALVASHFATTAHSIEQSADGKSTVLGRLMWIRFRISLDLPRGFHADRGLKQEQHPCS